ncbi:MAG: bifunctional helix-turn-helix transcriptional regulator/GNAT family N-acetyltransferase [Candidatus Zixiibacteriota bacterium]
MTGPGKDTIKDLGALAFASRLKRLSDRLARDISRVYEEHQVQFEARWFPVAYLLSQKSPLSVTEIAEQLEFTHPAVNQIAGQMERNDLLVSTRDRNDDRRRLISLTKKGKETVRQLQPLWEVIRRCTAELLQSVDDGFLESVQKIEDALDEKDMYGRVSEILYPQKAMVVDIIDFKPRWGDKFRELNEEWLNAYFRVEQADKVVLENPDREIIRHGGAVFFARTNGSIVGTAALIRHSDETYELAKMAVTAEFRGHGIGARLLETAIHRARIAGAKQLVLGTSLRLKEANQLYRKNGFRKLSGKPGWATEYARDTVYMRLTLAPSARK